MVLLGGKGEGEYLTVMLTASSSFFAPGHSVSTET